MYEIDEETMLVVNVTTYFINITRANLENKATWEVYHNILDAYGMEDASPSSFEKFANSLLHDENVMKQFNMWNAKSGPGGAMDSCDLGCRLGTYCGLVTSYADTEDECHVMAGLPSGQRPRKDPHSFTGFTGKLQRMFFFNEDQFYEFMADPWLEKI